MRTASRERGQPTEPGNAVVEFIGVLAAIVAPSLIFIVGAATIATHQFAIVAGAREAARAFVRAPDSNQAFSVGARAGNHALAERGISDGVITFTCTQTPCLTPGASVTAHVKTQIELPVIGATIPLEATVSMNVDPLRSVR